MIKRILKKLFKLMRIDYWSYYRRFILNINTKLLSSALNEQGYKNLLVDLRKIVPDISDQYSFSKDTSKEYHELKIRGMHAFQCKLMFRALDYYKNFSSKINVVDIGDSSGAHMLYLKDFMKDKLNIDSYSVNLDPEAIKKIKSKGLKALLSRAEDLDLGEQKIDFFVSFEMVEHLHNPSIFFRRLAKKSNGYKIVITVPYRRKSRVGLNYLRNEIKKKVYAENVHIFELCPEDWTKLMLHSGWRVINNEIYYQYPRKLPLLRKIFAWYWGKIDYEGFWGAILEKDLTYTELYQDWEL